MSTTVRNSKIGFNDIEKIAQQIRSLKKQFYEIENKKSEYQQFHKKKMIELQDVYNNINLYKTKILELLHKPISRNKYRSKSRTKSQYRKNVVKKQKLRSVFFIANCSYYTNQLARHFIQCTCQFLYRCIHHRHQHAGDGRV